MSLKKYFQDELRFLKKDGEEFSKINPHLAHFLGAGGSDPDAERLMEGFAFLSARLRQKIDDDFPEVTHSILNLLWPNYLRTVPSATIIEFEPKDRSTSIRQIIPKKTVVNSYPVDETVCKFTTCSESYIYPLDINKVDFSNTGEKAVISISLETLSDQNLDKLECDNLSFYFSGDDYTAQTCYLWFFYYLKEASITIDEKIIPIDLKDIGRQGFDKGESLLPYPQNVFDGYRLLQEFFQFPRRFYFLKLLNLEKYWTSSNPKEFSFNFHFSRPMPTDMLINKDCFKLYCIPAVNLFKHSSDPINFNGKELRYPIQPSTTKGKNDHFEIFSINKVSGVDTVTGKYRGDRDYKEFESFAHEVDRDEGNEVLYYKKTITNNLEETGFSHFISLVRSDETIFLGEKETVSIDLLCSNRNLPESLSIGDICVLSEETPSYVLFKNITKPTKPVSPILDGDLHWTLISNLSLNYLSLLQIDLLKNVLKTYDFLSFYDIQAKRKTQKRMDSILSIETEPMDLIVKGFPLRGVKTKMFVDDNGFSCEGELYLFGTVLANFFGLYTTINSFHSFEIVNTNNNESYIWNIQEGKQPII